MATLGAAIRTATSAFWTLAHEPKAVAALLSGVMGTHGDDGIAGIKWRLETRKIVEEYLREQGVVHSAVPLVPAAAMPPHVGLWHCKPDLWIIAGDVPTDHLTLPRGTGLAVVMHALSLRWKRAAAELAQGKVAAEMRLGGPQSRAERQEMAQALAGRAELLLDWALDGQDERMASREAIYTQLFGEIADPVWHATDDQSPHVDVYQFAPTAERPYWTLVTGGMSDLRQPALLDPDDGDDCAPRAELLMYVSEPKPWMMQVLKGLAAMPFDDDTCLYWGHTVPNGKPMTAEPSLLTSYFVEPAYLEDQASARFTIDGDEVALLWLRPVTEAERAYAIEHGSRALSQRLAEQLGPAVDEGRASVV